MTPATERRAFPRRLLLKPFACFCSAVGEMSCQSLDVSPAGIGLALREEFEVGVEFFVWRRGSHARPWCVRVARRESHGTDFLYGCTFGSPSSPDELHELLGRVPVVLTLARGTGLHKIRLSRRWMVPPVRTDFCLAVP